MPVGASSASQSGRPTLVIVVAIVASLLLLIGVGTAVGLAFSSGRSSAASNQEASDQINALLTPVSAANEEVGQSLSDAASSEELDGVSTDTAALITTITRAQGAASALQVDPQAKAALVAALGAHLAFAERLQAASATLDEVHAEAASTAAAAAQAEYATLASLTPSIDTPSPTSFQAVNQLEPLARAEARKKAEARSSKAAIRSYVTAIDSLLRNSVSTRSDLSSLISEAQQGAIGINEAQARIAGVISQRTALQTQVAALSPPAPFRQTAEIFRQSIADSLDDDRAIQGLINAYLDGTDPSPFVDAHQAATTRATADKGAFLRAYNKLRSKYLDLTPLPEDLRY